jgi:hypothetical protein
MFPDWIINKIIEDELNKLRKEQLNNYHQEELFIEEYEPELDIKDSTPPIPL